MKLLVFSDSHGNLDYMRRAVELEKPDKVLHLGDVTRDAERLREIFPALPVEQVRGNCDSVSSGWPVERELFAGGKRLWLLHGHTYRVKMGLSLLLEEARTRGVDGVFFGHTHRPLCDFDGRLWVMNPGTASGMPNATYGVAEINNGQLYCRTADFKQEG